MIHRRSTKLSREGDYSVPFEQIRTDVFPHLLAFYRHL
jgi:hypothetical protein